VIEIIEGSGTRIFNEVKQIYKDEFSEVLKEYTKVKERTTNKGLFKVCL